MASPGDVAILGWFPNLLPSDFVVTSPESLIYNCIAWAAGHTDAWWEPIRGAGYYRPELSPWDHRIESLVWVFEFFGFELCVSDEHEDGYEKVAIYGIGDYYEHAARMLQGGKWTSKLGTYKDIEHNDQKCLCGTSYGSVVKVLRKKITSPHDSTRRLPDDLDDPTAIPRSPRDRSGDT